jgi:hypothetical protein
MIKYMFSKFPQKARVIKLSPFAAVCIFLLMVGCSKKKDVSTISDAGKFQGTWVCTSSCNTAATTNLVLGLGYDVNSVLATGTSVGAASCVFPVTLTMVVTGNTISIPTQTFTDNCGKAYSVSGGGSIDSASSSILTLKESITLGTTTSTCTYTGHK